MKILSNIIHFFCCFFMKNIPTVEQARKKGLKHDTNVFGDGINIMDCRSIWYDKYGNMYRCDQLLENGRDVVIETILKDHPELAKMYPELLKRDN